MQICCCKPVAYAVMLRVLLSPYNDWAIGKVAKESNSGKCKRFFCCPKRPDLLWGPLGFLLGTHSPGLKWQ